MNVKIYLSFLGFILILFISMIHCLTVTEVNDTNSILPEEIQHAICKIATENIEASANATIKRELKGICTSKEVMERLDKLEYQLLYEIQSIKMKLQVDKDLNNKPLEKTKSSKLKIEGKNVSYRRDVESLKNNMTIRITEIGESLLYFWKIYDIEDILNNTDARVNSGVFYVQGTPVHIALHLRHLGTRYLTLELMSSLGFLPKHRFILLNQSDDKRDISSQVLGTTSPLFRIAPEKISKHFTSNGNLIIKAIISLL
ncbi:hypothetical protein FQA39_LY15529 [Lamprigera yunnana]|nr:hypothetical protein FQA39_LY15529 [Lamprigera yunnana]